MRKVMKSKKMVRKRKNKDGRRKFYHVIFDFTVYDSWRRIGTMQGLVSDSQIATFLIHHFHGSWHDPQTSFLCATCKAPLTLSCSKCLCMLPSCSPDQSRHASETLHSQPGLMEKQTEKLMPSLQLEKQDQHPGSVASADGEEAKDEDKVAPLYMDEHTEHSQDSVDCPVHFKDLSCNSSLEEVLRDKFRQKELVTSQSPQKLYSFNKFGQKERVASQCPQKLYSCNKCSSAFTQLGSLKRHLKLHAGEKPFTSNPCGGKFIEESSIKKHIQTHSSEKPFMCQVCGVSFTQSGSLKRHMRLHTGEKPFMCMDCAATFAEKGSLNKHLRTHSSEKPYLCQECGAAFTQSGSMRRHMMIHTGIKPYACTDCGAAFLERATLKIHVRRHTGEKPYMCPDCGAAFSQRSNLKIHKRKHVCHGDSEVAEDRGEQHSKDDKSWALVKDDSRLSMEQDTKDVDVL